MLSVPIDSSSTAISRNPASSLVWIVALMPATQSTNGFKNRGSGPSSLRSATRASAVTSIDM